MTAGVLVSLDYNQGPKTSIANSILNSYDGVVIVDEATRSYNCHAYAWHVSEGGDRVWIGMVSESDEDVYWEDGSYIEVPESLATKVSYQGNHSSVRISNTEYISKWGEGPLIKHSPNNVPPGYNPYATKKYFKRKPLDFSISGSEVLCGTTTYTLEGVPSGYLVSWSIDNADFSITPSGYQCSVGYVPANSSYSVANLKADISRNGYLVKSVTKHIVMHSNSLHVDGEQLDEITPSGVLSGFTFTIPESDRSSFVSSLSLQSNDDIEMLSVRDSLKRIIIDSLIVHPIDPGNPVGPIGPAYPYPIDWDDDPEFGFTEINGDANIFLTSDRFDGMNISFSGDHLPVSYSHLGTDVLFRMPPASSVIDDDGEYYVRLRASSTGGCHDFDLYFRVIPIEGEAYGDSEIYLRINGNSLEVSFFDNSVLLPNGQVQIFPWYLNIYEVSTGTRVHASTNTQNYKTINTSGWNSGIYLVRVTCNGNNYNKKFVISQ